MSDPTTSFSDFARRAVRLARQSGRYVPAVRVRDRVCMDQPRLSGAILRLDAFLRRRLAVIEYTSDPRCIFRVSCDEAVMSYALSDGTSVTEGDRIISLHIWNEHMPRLARGTTSLTWASRTARSIEISLRELALFLESREEFDDICVIRCTLALAIQAKIPCLTRITAHFGFETPRHVEQRASFAALAHRMGENMLALLILVATNPTAARLDVLRRSRGLACLSRHELIRRYGHGSWRRQRAITTQRKW